jgi:hypothetical protein
MRISTILDHIDRGYMALPEFQRGYVWNRDQVRGLLSSLYALVTSRLRNATAMHHANSLKRADATEAAWPLGLMPGIRRIRATRPLHILVEAVT